MGSTSNATEATTSKSKALDLSRADAPHHPGRTVKSQTGMQEAAAPFKPATGSLTETELQSNINLQHPGLNASDKRRRSQGDDREKLVSAAHPCVHATPCLWSAVRLLTTCITSWQHAEVSLRANPFSKSPAKNVFLPAGLKASSCSSYSEREFSASP